MMANRPHTEILTVPTFVQRNVSQGRFAFSLANCDPPPVFAFVHVHYLERAKLV